MQQVAGHQQAAMGCPLFHQRDKIVPCDRIEPVEGLIEHEQLRVVGQCTGQLGPLPHALGEGAGGPIGRCGEPHLVESEPGRIVAFARSETHPSTDAVPRYHSQADSADGGRTWTGWRKTPVQGKPPHLIKLRDGRLLVTYGRRVPPYGQRACVSADGGETWDVDHEIILRDDAPNEDLGYPATAQLDDGSLYTVYYQIDRAGEKPSLMGTHWRLA